MTLDQIVFRPIAGLLDKRIEVVAVNDLVPADNLAKYDSTQGKFTDTVTSGKFDPSLGEHDTLLVGGQRIKALAVREGPAALSRKEVGVKIVIECTGLFTDAAKARGHFEEGAKKVITSAPAKGEDITLAESTSLKRLMTPEQLAESLHTAC